MWGNLLYYGCLLYRRYNMLWRTNEIKKINQVNNKTNAEKIPE
jgi:hypothetical protein